jgi:hypothetical protein
MRGPNKSTLETMLLVFVIGCGIYFGVTSKQKLSDCSFPLNAEVLFTNKTIGKIPTVHYEYIAEGERYESSDILPKYSQRSDFPVGKKIRINVACSDHDISKIEY